MRRIKKIEFDDILENSFVFFSDFLIYNFSLKEKGGVFLSLSSKLGKSNKRNYLKRIFRYIWKDYCLKKNLIVIMRTNKQVKLSSLKYLDVYLEAEKIKFFLSFIFSYNMRVISSDNA